MDDQGALSHGVRITTDESGGKFDFQDLRVFNPSATESTQPMSFGERQAYGYLRLAQKTLLEVLLEARAEAIEVVTQKLGVPLVTPEDRQKEESERKAGRVYQSSAILPTDLYAGLHSNFPPAGHPDFWRRIHRITRLGTAPVHFDPHEMLELIDISLDLAETDRAADSIRARKTFVDLEQMLQPNGGWSLQGPPGDLTQAQRAGNAMADRIEEEKYRYYPEYRFLYLPVETAAFPELARPDPELAGMVGSWAGSRSAPPLYASIAALVYQAFGKNWRTVRTAQSVEFDWQKIPREVISKIQTLLGVGIRDYLADHTLTLRKLTEVPEAPREFMEAFFAYAPFFFAKTLLRDEMDARYVVPGAARGAIEKILLGEFQKWHARMEKKELRRDRNHLLLMAAGALIGLGWGAARLSLWLRTTPWGLQAAQSGSFVGRLLLSYSRLRRMEMYAGASLGVVFGVEGVWMIATLIPDYLSVRDTRRMMKAVFFGFQDITRPFGSALTFADIADARVMEEGAFEQLLISSAVLGLTAVPTVMTGYRMLFGRSANGVGSLVFRKNGFQYLTVREELVRRLAKEFDAIVSTAGKVEDGLKVDYIRNTISRAEQIRSRIRSLDSATYDAALAVRQGQFNHIRRLAEQVDPPKAELLQDLVDVTQDLRLGTKVLRDRLARDIKFLQESRTAQNLQNGRGALLFRQADDLGEIRNVLDEVHDYYKGLQQTLRSVPHKDGDTRMVRSLERWIRRVFRQRAPVNAAEAAATTNPLRTMQATVSVPLEQSGVPLAAVVGSEMEGPVAVAFEKVSPGFWPKMRSWANFDFQWDRRLIDAYSRVAVKRDWIKVSHGTLGRLLQKNLLNAGISYSFDRGVMSKDQNDWDQYQKKVWYINMSVGFVHSLMNILVSQSNITIFERPFARAFSTSAMNVMAVTGMNYRFFRDQDPQSAMGDLFSAKCLQTMASRNSLNVFWALPNDVVDRLVNASMSAVKLASNGSIPGAIVNSVIVGLDKTVLGPWAWKFISNKTKGEGYCQGKNGSILTQLAEIDPQAPEVILPPSGGMPTPDPQQPIDYLGAAQVIAAQNHRDRLRDIDLSSWENGE